MENSYNIQRWIDDGWHSTTKKLEYDYPDFSTYEIDSEVTSVLSIGIGAGRELLPLRNYKLYGIDLVEKDDIDSFLEDYTYYKCAIRDFADLDIADFHDMSDFLVVSRGGLMWESPKYQRSFIETVISRGCTNIILHDMMVGRYRLKLGPFEDLFNIELTSPDHPRILYYEH